MGDAAQWVFEDPGKPQPSGPKTRTRRSHHKSRYGCLTCKQRRVKCNEERPQCAQCIDRDLVCNYANTPSPVRRRSQESEENCLSLKTSISPTAASPAREAMRTEVLSCLDESSYDCNIFMNPTYTKTDAIDLLDHFLDCEDDWLGSKNCKETMQQHCVRLGINAPYVLQAIFAFSAAHLHYLYPDVNLYAIAKALHYDHFLRLYSKRLAGPLDPSEVDSLLAASMIHTMLEFGNVWDGRHDDTMPYGIDFTWLRTIQGKRAIVSVPAFRGALQHSIWSWMFVNWAKCRPRSEEPSVSILAFDPVRDSANTSAQVQAICYETIQPLLRWKESGQYGIEELMSFIPTLPQEFVQLLEQHDLQALRVYLIWLEMLKPVDQWWIQSFIKMEHFRITSILGPL